MSENAIGREPVQIVEIQQPFCANTFGSAPCTASGTADAKCYNTRSTCQDTANYSGSTLSLYFSTGQVAAQGMSDSPSGAILAEDGSDLLAEDGVPLLLESQGTPIYIIPSLRSVSTAPTRANLAGANPDAQGLGNRAVCTIRFNDHPHTDRRVDPYVDGRSWDPLQRASFWSKWAVRNRYKKGSLINVYEGYAGQSLPDMVKRSYFLESITGPDSQGNVTITGKDILAKLEERKAQAPLASPGELVLDLSDSATSFEIGGAELADYPNATNTLRIGDEVMTYTGSSVTSNGVTVTGVTRGTDNTTAEEHSAEDAVQLCLRYTNARVDDITEDLLTTYGGISSSYLNTADWLIEVDSYLSLYLMNTLITEPTAVTDLVSSLQENALFFLWWDERSALVNMKAIRGVDEEPDTITEEANILEGSLSLREKPRERASQVWVYYDRRSPVASITEEISYRAQSIFANLESEGDDLYGEPSIRTVFGRWLTAGALADTTASKIISRYVDIPSECTFNLDAKDRAYGVGDTVRISHHLDVDDFGERRLRNWTIVSYEEIQPGETARYVAEDTTLYGKITTIQVGGAADYPGTSAPFAAAYIGDASGLLSDGTNSARIN